MNDQRTSPDDGDADGHVGSASSPETVIYNKIHNAIAERRLAPGSRLVEEQLCDVFSASRARIRSVLHSLARDKVVTLHRNRGAVVALYGLAVLFGCTGLLIPYVSPVTAYFLAGSVAVLGLVAVALLENVPYERQATKASRAA